MGGRIADMGKEPVQRCMSTQTASDPSQSLGSWRLTPLHGIIYKCLWENKEGSWQRASENLAGQ